jgi:hypothetical protein
MGEVQMQANSGRKILQQFTVLRICRDLAFHFNADLELRH